MPLYRGATSCVPTEEDFDKQAMPVSLPNGVKHHLAGSVKGKLATLLQERGNMVNQLANFYINPARVPGRAWHG
jgi:hypothetical protein